ncbi:MAG TPA: hypothetical protein VFS61_03740, partial [Anaerolineales bacterium]|nr:hypothetical protein [Anaerolineales bacterium]
MRAFTNQFLNVPASDPDDARRRRLLNILLLGILVLDVAALIVVLIDIATRPGVDPAETRVTLFGIGLVLVGTLVIYQINRRYSSRWAATLFLLLLTIVLCITDSPLQLTEGRSLFLFT